MKDVTKGLSIGKRPDGCSIEFGMELMATTIEGPFPENQVVPVFEIERQCEVDGCTVTVRLATEVKNSRKFFYQSRGEGAVKGVCQINPVSESGT